MGITIIPNENPGLSQIRVTRNNNLTVSRNLAAIRRRGCSGVAMMPRLFETYMVCRAGQVMHLPADNDKSPVSKKSGGPADTGGAPGLAANGMNVLAAAGVVQWRFRRSRVYEHGTN
jgi:hypothetical protein